MMTASSSAARATTPSRGAGVYAVRPAHLATLLAQVEKRGTATVVAVQVRGPWTGGDTLSVGTRTWRVVRAASVLAIREALVEHEDAAADARLVILTPLETQELGWDVLARIARQRVMTLESWELLQDLFRAHGVDPRVARLGWLADVLLEHAPVGGYPAAPSGVLDLDTAWAQALGVLLGLPGGAPDALTLLRWSSRDGAAARWNSLSEEVRRGIADRLGDTAGAIGRVLASAISSGRGEQLVALGLVCGVLWPENPVADASVRETLAAARIRLEPIVGGTLPDESVGREWSALARRLLGELPSERASTERSAAERLLEELRAASAAELSPVLPAGAVRRAESLGRAITAWIAEGGTGDRVDEARRRFVEHEAVRGSTRAERATMAARLVRAMTHNGRGASTTEGDGFPALVARHVREGSWYDSARVALMAGDTSGALSSAYSELLRRAREHRESANRRFAERLAAWNVHPASEPEFLPVERVLEQVVAPIAEARPVMVLVLDGMDLVVWRQLHRDLVTRGWTWWRPDSATVAPVAIAMLPSVTTFSRTSLLAGEPMAGGQSQEQQQFASHHALGRSTVGGRRPVLFHKGDLGGADGLAGEVRRAIGDSRQRVVGVVINAIDDWLDRSDQVTPRWSIDAIPLLDALLQEAALGDRAVIVLSDHGHLLDQDTRAATGGSSARWRPVAAGAPVDGEITVSGARVRAVTGQESVVLAWKEGMRYTGKKTGYHGGASPQEVIAPIAVLSRDELGVAGWRPVLDATPAWWDEPESAVSADRSPGAAARGTRRSTRTPPQLASISAEVSSSAVPVQPSVGAAAWIGVLLASPVFASQRGIAGRMAPRDEQLRALLETLDRYNGRAPRAAIASALSLSEMRVRGVVAGARRVLNVEGFAVLEEEEATGTLTLNRELLRVQFGLGE